MYKSISTYYDSIFPLDQSQIQFIQSFIDMPQKNPTMLDIGCATGSLSIELAKLNYIIFSIDFDSHMIHLANEKKKNIPLLKYPIFKHLDMRVISQNFSLNFFDHVICFGNTLVHLLKPEEIFNFLGSAYSVLKQHGYFLIQILNYDYILEQNIKTLPIIENQCIRFERSYEYSPHTNLIEFKTKLILKNNEEIITNTLELYPIKKFELESLLNRAGFKAIHYFGNFNKDMLKENSLPLVIAAQKI